MGPRPRPRQSPTQSAAGLLAAKFSSRYTCRICKKVISIQRFVAAEVVGIPVQLSRARPGLYEYVGAASAAILSIVERILNFELLNRIRRGNRQPATAVRSCLGHVGTVAICIHPVQHEIVVAAAGTIRANLPAPSCVASTTSVFVPAVRPRICV